MALNKKCCIKCWENNENVWSEGDEKEWKYGRVWCPFKHTRKYGIIWEKINITEEPPINCPYLLEYVLNKED